MEIIEFDVEDVIATSDGNNDGTGEDGSEDDL